MTQGQSPKRSLWEEGVGQWVEQIEIQANLVKEKELVKQKYSHQEVQELKKLKKRGRFVSSENHIDSFSKCLYIYDQNFCSIRSTSKFEKFIANLSLSSIKPHIISLIETWLDRDCDPAYYSIESYNVYRIDRSTQTYVRVGGGGCLIAISKKLISSPIHFNIDEV